MMEFSKTCSGKQNWKLELLKDVSVVPKIGTPGALLVWGNNCQPILSGECGTDILMAAAQVGLGRIIAFSHDGYIEAFFEDSNDDLKQLFINISNWVLKSDDGHKAIKVQIKDRMAPEELSEHDKASSILVWALPNSNQSNMKFLEGLLEYVKDGGALILGVCPWGWLCLNEGKAMEDNPHSHILRECGMYYTDGYMEGSDNGIHVNVSQADDMHLGNVLDLLARGKFNEASCHPVLSGGNLSKLPQEILGGNHSLFLELLSKMADHPPSHSRPIKTSDAEEKAYISVLEMFFCQQNISLTFGDVKAPGIAEFPGDFVNSSFPVMEVELQIDSYFGEWHSTGYYLPAGQQMCVTRIEGEASKWYARIGCHSDVLPPGGEFRRWPNIVTRVPLNENSMKISTAFGGLIYFESPGVTSSLRIKMENVVQSPYFDLTDPESHKEWSQRCKAPGLWAELAGELVIITLPSTAVRHIKDPVKILQLYDRLIAGYHNLRGTDPRGQRRERIVTDEQPSAGYMHAGHPVVTQMDVSEPDFENDCDAFLLNDKFLSEHGFWGVFHEFGHNMQREVWTFDGTVEVTCNIFTLYGQHIISGIDPWTNPKTRRTLEVIEDTLNNPDFRGIWRHEDPFVDLFIYMQLQHCYGWQTFKGIYRMYEVYQEQDKENVKNNQDRIDLWVTRFSEVVNQNICPLFDFWGVPVSDTTRTELEQLESFLPDDEVINLAPARTKTVLQKYPSISRNPKSVNHQKLWKQHNLSADEPNFQWKRKEPYTKVIATKVTSGSPSCKLRVIA